MDEPTGDLDSKSTVEINGFIFLQARSGISYIFVDNENFNKHESNIIEMKPEIKQNIQKENSICNTSDENVFLIKKDVKPDVYHVYDKDNNLVHFASIPDTHTSQYVYNILKNIDSAYFKCTLCPIWKRYKPLIVVNA